MYNLELRPNRRHFWNNHSVLEKELDKFFENVTQTENFFAPTCEVRDEEKYFTVSLDIPGIKKEEINIEVKENELYITGERKFAASEQKDNVLRSERRYGKFSRVFTIPSNVNTDGIEARFENGVLDLVLPKEEKAQSRKISISDWKETSGVKN